VKTPPTRLRASAAATCTSRRAKAVTDRRPCRALPGADKRQPRDEPLRLRSAGMTACHHARMTALAGRRKRGFVGSETECRPSGGRRRVGRMRREPDIETWRRLTPGVFRVVPR
jgi:hypothetical protein